MIGHLRLLLKILRNHPQLVSVVPRVAWRNLTGQIDYLFKRGKSLAPKLIAFRVSGHCNLNCQMCIYRNSGFLDHRQLLPADLMRRVIDEVQPAKPFVSFTGGEPLLHPDIFDCIRYAKEKDLLCSLVTNGWDLAQYAEAVAESGVDILSISIDGPAEIHDQIRGRAGVFRRALEGVHAVRRLDRQPLLFFNASIQADNIAYISSMVDIAIDAGVDGINFSMLWTRPPERAALHNRCFPAYPVRDGWVDESLLQVDFEVLQQGLSAARRKGLMVNVYPGSSIERIRAWYTEPMSLLKNRRLKCPWMLAFVFHDGTLRMCDDVILGSLHEEGFWEIWNGERMCGFRQSLKDAKHFPICAGCCSLFRDHIM